MGIDELESAWNAKADRFNQWHELGLDEIVEFAQEEERKACAKVCRQRADKIAAEADRCATEEPDEVSALRSAAWQLTVAENEILKRSNAIVRGGSDE